MQFNKYFSGCIWKRGFMRVKGMLIGTLKILLHNPLKFFFCCIINIEINVEKIAAHFWSSKQASPPAIWQSRPNAMELTGTSISHRLWVKKVCQACLRRSFCPRLLYKIRASVMARFRACILNGQILFVSLLTWWAHVCIQFHWCTCCHSKHESMKIL